MRCERIVAFKIKSMSFFLFKSFFSLDSRTFKQPLGRRAIFLPMSSPVPWFDNRHWRHAAHRLLRRRANEDLF